MPKDGCVFIDADYSQIELRVLAHMSGDERLIEAYRSAQDIHALTASQVFHVPLEEVTPQLRRNAKAVNFGIVYGISAFGLSEDLSPDRRRCHAVRKVQTNKVVAVLRQSSKLLQHLAYWHKSFFIKEITEPSYDSFLNSELRTLSDISQRNRSVV